MQTQECFVHHRNNVYVILNWQVRKDEFDVMLLDPLDTQQLVWYQELVKDGYTDDSIYKKLYPEALLQEKKVLVNIELLSKEQLVHLINSRLGKTLTSLIRVSSDDLKSLFLGIEVLASTE